MDNQENGLVFLTIIETNAHRSFHVSGPIDEAKRLHKEWLERQQAEPHP